MKILSRILVNVVITGALAFTACVKSGGNDYGLLAILLGRVSGVQQVAAPAFTPSAGTHHSDISIEITSGGDHIYYEMTAGTVASPPADPDDPTDSSSEYLSTPISVSGDNTVVRIKAIAVKEGMADSDVLYGEFIINILYPGEKEVFSVDGISFNMVYVPGGITFPTAKNDLGAPATVDNAYWIGETEVTYELWYAVYDWAVNGSGGAAGEGEYAFSFTSGFEPRAGSDGTPGSETASQEPATHVNWRHALVWCNALTEWYNASNGTAPDLSCVYYTDAGFTAPLRSADDTAVLVYPDPGGQDDPYVDPDADGFRLLASSEWELAARWRNDAVNTVAGYTDPYFTKGDSASNATTYHNDSSSGSGEPGKSANDLVAVYGYYWDGDSWEPTGVTGTAAVKSKTLGANSLGLYDMSGNVWEWCFDWYTGPGSIRVRRGGCWSAYDYTIYVANTAGLQPYGAYNFLGFRLGRTE
ncbi:MAG: SUMF1/EgtB/PvdO family nonheme iron enzyme [Spirochaetes bacterium]|nr:SUMF1/EgtB/PvdO family nonheme iron enzyme [Spirochaetota bacterium]